MKYIEYPELSQLSRTLTHDSAECTVHTRIEAYSCKSIRHEKRLFKALEHSYAEDVAASQSPPGTGPDVTAFGPMDKHSSRKTLYLLIATLNTSFPDRDFSGTQASNFRREESGQHVLSALSTTLAQLNGRPNAAGDIAPRSYSSYPPLLSGEPSLSSSPGTAFRSPVGQNKSAVHPVLHKMLDDIIGIADSEVYSFTPDGDDDPHAGDSDSEASSDDDDDDSFSDADEDQFIFEQVEDDDPFASPKRPGASSGATRRSSSHNSAQWSPLDDARGPGPRRTRGRPQHKALLWSSHWFFHNPKMKRVLFVTVWARSKGGARWVDRNATTDKFVAWSGASGAGARALALGMKRPTPMSL